MAKVAGKKQYIKQLWPVSILTRRFGKFQQVNPELIRFFRDYQQQHPGKSGSVYSSPDNFAQDVDNPAIHSLTKFIMDNVFDIASELNKSHWSPSQSINIDITGMWFQISNDFGFHEMHVHGNCSWSGVYYVQSGSASQSDSDRHTNGMPNGITRFYGPYTEYNASGHGDLGNYYLMHGSYDSYPEDGKLVVFPSYLKHMVFPYQGEQDRIIVSFHAQVNGDQELRYRYSFT